MVLMIFAFVVLVVLILLFVYLLVQLGLWPGRIAKARGHAHTDAVNVLSWGGLLLTAGLAWLGALVWAYAAPGGAAATSSASGSDGGEDRDTRLAGLLTRVHELEAELQALKA